MKWKVEKENHSKKILFISLIVVSLTFTTTTNNHSNAATNKLNKSISERNIIPSELYNSKSFEQHNNHSTPSPKNNKSKLAASLIDSNSSTSSTILSTIGSNSSTSSTILSTIGSNSPTSSSVLSTIGSNPSTINSFSSTIDSISPTIKINQIDSININVDSSVDLSTASRTNKYIIEIAEEGNSKSSKRGHSSTTQITKTEAVINEIKENYPNVKIEKVFNTVFNGISVTINHSGETFDTSFNGASDKNNAKVKQAQSQNAKIFQSAPQVKDKGTTITSIKSIPGVKAIHATNTFQVKLDDSVPFIGGDAIRNQYDPKQQHLTGKGVKVGVIDTGIDYNHPDLQKNYQGGFDLVDDDHDPMETVKSQGEPTLHGTHVAGIIAANGRLKGVAPEAEIYAYRALGPGGVGTSDQVIAAIEKAVEDGMDIINLSLGSSVNGPDYPTSVALDRAVEKGVIAVTSNGNSGPNLWTVGSPGSSQKAISVGASTPPLEVPYLSINSIPEKAIPLQPLQGSKQWNLTKGYKLVDVGLGTLEEMNEKDIVGNIALIERGKIPFTEKARNAAQKGAKAAVIFNNEKGNFSGGIEEKVDIPAVAISREDGMFIKAELKKGTRYLDTKKKKIQDQIADFSSRGPVTHSWTIKPDVVAPGVEIDSTVPDGYLALRGTSMASPHVAGACALIKQAHPDWTPDEVKAALMNTAKQLQADDGRAYVAAEQGAGRIQLDKAIKATVLAYPASLAFGTITQNEKNNKQIITKSVTVSVENKSAMPEKMTFQIPNYKKGVNWRLPLSFFLNPNEKKQIKINLEVDPTQVPKGFHNGIVTLETSSSNINFPYLFVVGDPQHPRISGFSIEEEDGVYKCELYLPEGADELGIALFEPTTLKYVGLLLHQKGVKRGLFEQTLSRNEIQFADGIYKAFAFAMEGGIESVQESEVELRSD